MIAFTLFGCSTALLVYYITVKIIDHYNKLYPYIHAYRFYWEDGYNPESAITYIIEDLETTPLRFNKHYKPVIRYNDTDSFTIRLIRRDFT